MEEEKENLVEEVVQKEEPVVDDKVEGLKVKMKQYNKPTEDVVKVDLSKKEEDAVSEQSTDEVPVRDEPEVSEEVQQENVETTIEEITGESADDVQDETPAEKEVVEEKVTEVEKTPMPENVDKLLKFIEETGGDIDDYVRLNQDFSKMDNLTALNEYYKQTKPHLNAEERQFLMDETFKYDEEVDDAKDIRKKKIALKEQVAEAKAYLDGQKSKYYDEIKAGSKLTAEQQKAVDFFNRYNKESEERQNKFNQAKKVFDNKTENLFSQNFKGFEYAVGEKKFRFNVKNTDSVRNNQSDINNFVKKFLNKEGMMEDAAGYHKGLYTAMNADAVAKHFYEQGKADAIKESIEKSKNINMNPRQVGNEIEVSGAKYKVLSGDSRSDLKFKIKK